MLADSAQDGFQSFQSDMPKNEFSSMIKLSTPVEKVSAFCQSVIRNVFPNQFFDDANSEHQNQRTLMQAVDAFIKASRYESFTLEYVLEGLKVRL